MSSRTAIGRDDILPLEEFAKIRKEKRQELVGIKRNRRIEVGPVATFYFENYDTMWWQIHEMLFIEKGGDEQVADELAAYNPLIPKGRELVCTIMFEIDEPVRRANFLARLGGVEETVFLEFAGEKVMGVPEADVDRTTADGKASSVQFVHFPFTDDQVAKFKAADTQVVIGFGHEQYAHMALMPDAVRAALATDFL
ncbi:MAG: DUF3501 family protein [Pseudomonadota bacterium]